MKFLDFKTQLSPFRVFSIKDIEKLYPDFNKMNLVNWQKKNYITKLRNGYYRFNDLSPDESELFFVANKIYQPSYISLETALSYYGFIPEGVFSIQSISTQKTQTFKNTLGTFRYYNTKPSAYLGYKLIGINDLTIRMASPEKALLDTFHIRHKVKNFDDLAGLRLNNSIIKEMADFDKMMNYALLFGAKYLVKAVELLKKHVYDQY